VDAQAEPPKAVSWAELWRVWDLCRYVSENPIVAGDGTKAAAAEWGAYIARIDRPEIAICEALKRRRQRGPWPFGR